MEQAGSTPQSYECDNRKQRDPLRNRKSQIAPRRDEIGRLLFSVKRKLLCARVRVFEKLVGLLALALGSFSNWDDGSGMRSGSPLRISLFWLALPCSGVRASGRQACKCKSWDWKGFDVQGMAIGPLFQHPGISAAEPSRESGSFRT